MLNLGFIYLIQSPIGIYKIGKANDVRQRLANLRGQFKADLKLIHAFEAVNVLDVEWAFHTHFRHRRAYGEWFTLDAQDLEEFFDYANIYARQCQEMKAYLNRRNDAAMAQAPCKGD